MISKILLSIIISVILGVSAVLCENKIEGKRNAMMAVAMVWYLIGAIAMFIVERLP